MKNNFYISVVGRSNVGKSTLVNFLCNKYVTSSSSKPQTTRINIYNELKINDSNIILVDTPGISTKENNLLSKSMQNEYLKALNSINLLILVTDSLKFGNFENSIINLNSINNKIIYVVNKIDKLKNNEYDLLRSSLKRKYNDKIFFISLLKKIGLKDFIDKGITKNLTSPNNNHQYKKYYNQNKKLFTQELIRGVIVELTKFELPYDSAVKVITFTDKKDLKIIKADIYVDKENQKKIIIGKNGEMLKNIGTQSRKILEKNFQCKFFIDLKVLVKKNWKNNYVFLKDLGYIN